MSFRVAFPKSKETRESYVQLVNINTDFFGATLIYTCGLSGPDFIASLVFSEIIYYWEWPVLQSTKELHIFITLQRPFVSPRKPNRPPPIQCFAEAQKGETVKIHINW